MTANADVSDGGEFPKYLMTVDGKASFMSMKSAGIKLSSLWERVEVGNLVLEADFSVRKITKEENNRMTTISDRCDEDK